MFHKLLNRKDEWKYELGVQKWGYYTYGKVTPYDFHRTCWLNRTMYKKIQIYKSRSWVSVDGRQG